MFPLTTMTAPEIATSGRPHSSDASVQTKSSRCRDPEGNVVLQASDNTQLFRIRDEDGLFDNVPGSVTENTKLILIESVTSDELELLVSRCVVRVKSCSFLTSLKSRHSL